jgi:hypothetical protein
MTEDTKKKYPSHNFDNYNRQVLVVYRLRRDDGATPAGTPHHYQWCPDCERIATALAKFNENADEQYTAEIVTDPVARLCAAQPKGDDLIDGAVRRITEAMQRARKEAEAMRENLAATLCETLRAGAADVEAARTKYWHFLRAKKYRQELNAAGKAPDATTPHTKRRTTRVRGH